MYRLPYETQDGHKGVWDLVSLPKSSLKPIGTSVIPLLLDPESGKVRILLMATYRIPMQKYVLEMPSGRFEGEEELSLIHI